MSMELRVNGPQISKLFDIIEVELKSIIRLIFEQLSRNKNAMHILSENI